MNVTMKDIAESAGVSVRTVSRALKQSGYIASDKAEIIRDLAKRMNYIPDDMARGIKIGKTKVIGFASCNPCSEHIAKIMDSLSTCADKHGYMIKIVSAKYINRHKGRFKQVADICIKNRLSALVLHGISDFEILERLKNILDKHNIELALVSNINVNINVNNYLHVTSCDTNGIAQAVTYLHELGHRNFVFISLELEHPASVIRCDAYIDTLKKLGITNTKICADNYQKIQLFLDSTFLKNNKRPTAIVCSGDNIAVFVKDYLSKKYSISTPEDVSITGYGDFSIGIYCYPELTTVYEPFMEMGEKIIEKVVAKLEGHNFGKLEEFIDTKLIARGSTAPPAK